MKNTLPIIVASIVLSVTLNGCARPVAAFTRSDHFDGKRFHNTAPVPPESFFEDVRVAWEMTRRRAKWPKHVDAPRSKIAAPVVLHGMKATFIGHATVLVQVGGLNILTDPVFSDYIGINRMFSQRRVTNAGVRLEDLPHIDVILISHNHYDHLNLPSLEKIASQQGNDAPRILTGLGNKTLLEKHGLRNVSELDWGDAVEIGGMMFHFLEAVHTSRRGLFDTNKTLWGAFLVQTPEGNVFFAGDTAYDTHFHRAYEQYGAMRLALLPIGAYKPRWFMYREHMDPEEAVKAHMDLHSAQSIAIHFQAFNSASEGYDEPVTDLTAALNKCGISDTKFLVLESGQTGPEVANFLNGDLRR